MPARTDIEFATIEAALEDIGLSRAFGWDAALRTVAAADVTSTTGRRPSFGHGAEAAIGPYQIIGSFHPRADLFRVPVR